VSDEPEIRAEPEIRCICEEIFAVGVMEGIAPWKQTECPNCGQDWLVRIECEA
jgi:hypothetical protein